MTTKTKNRMECSACGAEHPKWQGRCSECGEWGTIVEARAAPPPGGRRFPGMRPSSDGAGGGGAARPTPLPEVEEAAAARFPTGIGELDRVLGGGVVGGSAILVAGDPGIGKSTLLLQASGGLAAAGRSVLYVAGEESPSQIRLRAERLGIRSPRIHLLAETDLDAIAGHALDLLPNLLVVDSIQTIAKSDVASAPGSVSQVRECAAALASFAKATGVPVVLIGHVTKTGDVAGPRVLSHVVDAVLSFEGDRYHAYRVLRAVKNRFGPAEEVGLFEMRPEGLGEVAGPAGLLFSSGGGGPGSVVAPVAEGTRILLLEVQALVAPAAAPPGRRRVTGLDGGRLDLLLAVLEKKAGMPICGRDVFVNAVGGVRAEEPGTDLAAVLAAASSLLDLPFPRTVAAFGEVGLLGEVRPVARSRARIAEAAKLGFKAVLAPPESGEVAGIRTIPVATVVDALRFLRAAAERGR